jgi:hypothetical protein
MAETEKKKYDEYIESDAVRAAKTNLEQQMAQKPGAYQSQWQNSLNEAMNKILNREKFSYDLNGDALYNQYKDRYVQQGKQAMMDTMGSASALTGGYGNSWAQSAGQQAYHGYLQGLNDKVPELYQMALDKYNMEGQDLLNQYGLLSDREGQDYGRYRDALSDYLTERNFLTDRYDTERNYDYGMFSDNRDFSYTQDRDAVADARWQAEFDEAIKRFLATADPATRAYYEAYGKTPEEGGESSSTGNPIMDAIMGNLGGKGTSGSGSALWTGSTKASKNSTSGDIVNEIIRGEWGNGQDRKDALKAAGYSDAEIKEIQAQVNKKMDGVTDTKTDKSDKPVLTEEEKKVLNEHASNTANTSVNVANSMFAREILLKVNNGTMSTEEAEELKKKYNISDAQFELASKKLFD